ncbi:MAG: hypothetical protein KAS32_29125 [Candidatus Peribacteraceae bacterium]|nr:hypothetical protein [Candidatus Peribacteraceae bacterium]
MAMNAQNDLENFLNTIPGIGDVVKDMDNKITPSGDFKSLTELDVIIRGLFRLLLIPERSYFMDPNIGTGLYKFIYEPADSTTLQRISTTLQSAISRYENRTNSKVTFEIFFFKNRKGYRIEFDVTYKGEKKSTSVDITETLLKTLT